MMAALKLVFCSGNFTDQGQLYMMAALEVVLFQWFYWSGMTASVNDVPPRPTPTKEKDR